MSERKHKQPNTAIYNNYNLIWYKIFKSLIKSVDLEIYLLSEKSNVILSAEDSI